MKAITFGALALASFFGLGIRSAAGLGRPDPGDIERRSAELGLTPQQTKILQDVSEESRAQQRKFRAEVDLVEIDLRRELERDTPDEKKVAQFVDRISALEAQTRKTQIAGWLKVRAMLTKEQRQKLEVRRRPAAGFDDEDFLDFGIEQRALQDRVRQKIRIATDRLHDAEGLRVDRDVLVIKDGEAAGEPSLMVSTHPEGEVLVDGKSVGRSPARTTVKPGQHTITMKVGNRTVEQKVDVQKGQRIVIDRDFR